MKSAVLLGAAVCLPLTLSGCKTTESAFDNDCKVGGTAIGAVIGGVAGGLLFGKGGGKVGSALLGATLGGLIGQQIGSVLDCQDQQAMATASQAAGDASTGQKIIWAADNAQVPPAAVVDQPEATRPEAAATSIKTPNTPPTPAKQKAKATPQKSTTTARNPPPPAANSDQWAIVEPEKQAEPIRSGGQSGMWGWVEPISAPTTAANGQTCRDLKQVVVDPSGKRHEETVTSCLNNQKQWVVASR
jgi:surface antigen